MCQFLTYESLISKVLETEDPTKTFNEIRFFPIGFDGIDLKVNLKLNFPDGVWCYGTVPEKLCTAACVKSEYTDTLSFLTKFVEWDYTVVLKDGTTFFLFYIVDKNDKAEEQEKQNLVSES